MKEINVTGLQCTQAVMAVLRELMPMDDNEEIDEELYGKKYERKLFVKYKNSKGNVINSGGVTTFSNYSIISENRLTIIPNKIPIAKKIYPRKGFII